MALIPTVFVSTVVKDQVGEPVRGAVVEAKLTTVDRWQGYIVPKSYKGFTGADGICRLAVFPNELGTEGSEYLFDIKLPDGTGFSALATVPNRDCCLHDITELEPYDPRGTGAVITSEVAAYADAAAKASSEALKSAKEARLYALDAVPDEGDPQSFGSAKYHAEKAALAAKAAEDWAESENSPGVEGTKSSKRWAESMTEHGNFSVFRIIFITKLCLHKLSTRFRELLAKAEEEINKIISSVVKKSINPFIFSTSIISLTLHEKRIKYFGSFFPNFFFIYGKYLHIFTIVRFTNFYSFMLSTFIVMITYIFIF